MLAFLVLYYVVTLVVGLLIGGAAGHDIGSDWWVGIFLGILPTSSKYGIKIGRLRALFLVGGAAAFLYYAKTITGVLIPFTPTEQIGTIEVIAAFGAEILIGSICVKLVGQFVWKGFLGDLFS
jgi:hypothetical protein